MPVDLIPPAPLALSFALVLARVSGVFAFLPIPGARATLAPVKVVLAVCLTFALYPLWPSLPSALPGGGQIAVWMLADLLLGLACGLVIGLLSDLLVFAVQAVSLQAGFSYASTIDPSSEADSNVLQVTAQLFGNLLFFSLGLYAPAIKLFARSLEVWPPGQVNISLANAIELCDFGSLIFRLALRIALPVAGILMLTDITLAVLGRLQSQLQLLSLSFPAKMSGALLLLAAVAPLVPRLYEAAAKQGFLRLSALVR